MYTVMCSRGQCWEASWTSRSTSSSWAGATPGSAPLMPPPSAAAGCCCWSAASPGRRAGTATTRQGPSGSRTAGCPTSPRCSTPTTGTRRPCSRPTPPPRSPPDMAAVTEGRNDPALTEVLIAESRDALAWLHDKGLRYRLMYERQAYPDAQGRHVFWGGLAVGSTGGGKGLIEQHTAAAAKAGVEVRYGVAGSASWSATAARSSASPGTGAASGPSRSSSPRAASRPTPGCGGATWARAGSGRRCAAPRSTPGTCSPPRWPPARPRTATGAAATAWRGMPGTRPTRGTAS